MGEQSFGGAFHEWRSSQELSRVEIQERSGVVTSHLHYIETDKSLPSAETLERIADAFGVDMSELIEQRNHIFFSRLGLDGEVATRIHELGELDEAERELLLAITGWIAGTRGDGETRSPEKGR